MESQDGENVGEAITDGGNLKRRDKEKVKGQPSMKSYKPLIYTQLIWKKDQFSKYFYILRNYILTSLLQML